MLVLRKANFESVSMDRSVKSKDNDADDEGNGVDDGFYTVGTGAIGRRTSVCVNGN